MGATAVLRKVARGVPLALTVVSVTSLVVSLALTLALSDAPPTGGLPLPYISDTGSRPPQQYVFTLGLSLGGGGLGLLGVLNVLSFRERDSWNSHAKRCVYASAPFAVLAGLCLALLAILDTRNYPSPHLYAAIAFFVFNGVFITLNTVAYTVYWRQDDDARRVAVSAVSKLVLCVLFWLAFIVYLPVGLGLTYGAPPDGVDCWLYDERTRLYDYRGCLWMHLMRSATQYLTVLFSLLFYGTFTLDLFRGELGDDFELS